MSYKDGGWVGKYLVQKLAKQCRGCQKTISQLVKCQEQVVGCPEIIPADEEAKYFILRFDTDPHARVAMSAYSASVIKDNRELAADIQQQLKEVPLKIREEIEEE